MDSESLPTHLRTAAADAVDCGLSILYPTTKERKELLRSLIAKVCVMMKCARFGSGCQFADAHPHTVRVFSPVVVCAIPGWHN